MAARKRGLWANIHAKQDRIENGSGEHMHKPGEEGAPTGKAIGQAGKPAKPQGKTAKSRSSRK